MLATLHYNQDKIWAANSTQIVVSFFNQIQHVLRFVLFMFILFATSWPAINYKHYSILFYFTV